MSYWYLQCEQMGRQRFTKSNIRFDSNGKCTDILMARSSLSDKQTDSDPIHVYKVGETGQGATFKDDQGRVFNLS